MKNFRRLVTAGAVLVLFMTRTMAMADNDGVVDYGAQSSSKSDKAAVSSGMAPYLAALEKTIGGKGPTKFIGQVKISFTIGEKGAVSDIKTTKSSQMPQIDTRAMTAVKSSAPFPALPAGAGKTINVEVTFDGTSQASTCHAIRTQ